jgi:hypothetical protein
LFNLISINKNILKNEKADVNVSFNMCWWMEERSEIVRVENEVGR